MKSLNQYITEFININNVKKKEYYQPETKDELIKIIVTELKDGNTDLNCINTSNITDMSNLFNQNENSIKLTKEQQETLDVSKWDVSKVEDMHNMFSSCKQFNCDLSKWDVSNVTNMYCMFYMCEHFNCDLSKWDTSNIVTTVAMFYGCKQFKSDLSKWNISEYTNMGYMFYLSGLEGNEPSWYEK